MMLGARDLAFWSVVVGPKKQPTKVELEQETDTSTFFHVTNVALDANPKPGVNTLSIQVGDRTCVLATLGKDINTYQAPLDFVLDETAVFTNSGETKLHICGYMTASGGGGDDDDDDELLGGDDSDEGEDDDDDDEEDDDMPPRAVPIANGKVRPVPAAGRRGGAALGGAGVAIVARGASLQVDVVGHKHSVGEQP